MIFNKQKGIDNIESVFSDAVDGLFTNSDIVNVII